MHFGWHISTVCALLFDQGVCFMQMYSIFFFSLSMWVDLKSELRFSSFEVGTFLWLLRHKSQSSDSLSLNYKIIIIPLLEVI